ncbi:MAG: energy transducer TonB, partial [Acidobacteriota bacterium]
MTAMAAYAPQFGLPWDRERDDVRRFRRWLLVCLAAITALGIVVPLLPVPEVDRQELEELPPQLARIVLEKPEPVVPPPPPKPEVVQEEKVVPEEKPEPKPEPKPEARPEPEPKPTVVEAREKAAVSGLLAFQDAFADMRDAVDLDGLKDTGAIQQGKGEAATIDRALLTSKHGTRSSGVNVSELSRDTGGVALAGRETTKVEAPAEAAGMATATAQAEREGDGRQRSIEDVRRVFDANKGAIFAIYNRALRQDPTL